MTTEVPVKIDVTEIAEQVWSDLGVYSYIDEYLEERGLDITDDIDRSDEIYDKISKHVYKELASIIEDHITILAADED